MIIQYSELEYSCVNWEKNSITIGKGYKYWKMGFCHELAHTYQGFNAKIKKIRKDAGKQLFIRELHAWRMAKTFCKSKFWNESNVKSCLKNYAIMCNININLNKLKIIPKEIL